MNEQMSDMVSIFKETKSDLVVNKDHPVIKKEVAVTMLMIRNTKVMYPRFEKVLGDNELIFQPMPGMTISIKPTDWTLPGMVFNTTDRAHIPISELFKYKTEVEWNDEVINNDNLGGLFRIDTIHRGETKYTTEIGILQNFNSNIVHFDCLFKIPNERHITIFDKRISIPEHYGNTEILVKRLESEDVKFF